MTSAVAETRLVELNKQIEALGLRIDAKESEVKQAVAKVEAAAAEVKAADAEVKTAAAGKFAEKHYDNLVIQLNSLNIQLNSLNGHMTLLLSERATLSAGAGPSGTGGVPAGEERRLTMTSYTSLADEWAYVVASKDKLAAADAQFSEYWIVNNAALLNLPNLRLRRCMSEQAPHAPGCYEDGAAVVQAITHTLMGPDAAGHVAAYFINQAGAGGTRPDVAWCGLHKDESITAREMYNYLTLALEYKRYPLKESLKAGFGQLIDRAGLVVKARNWTGLASATLAGAVCDNVSIKPYIITSSNERINHKVCTTTTALFLVQKDANGNELETVDTSLQGYQELVYLCWLAAQEQIMRAAADPKTVCLKDGQHVAVRASEGVQEYLVLGRLGTPSASGCSYLARPVTEGAAAQQPVVLKVGAPPQLEKQSRCLHLAPEQWGQVKREVRILSHLGPAPAQSLLPVMVSHGQLDVGCSSSSQCLQGAAALVTLLFGEALVQPDGVLPQLPPAEVEQLMWDLLQALSELQVRGIWHNDVHPRNMGQRPVPVCPRYYLYDFGSAMTGAEMATGQLCRQPCSLHFSSLEVLTGELPGPLADAQSLIFCGIALAGLPLPWQDLADSQQLWRCVGRRADFMENPQLLPGWQQLFSPELRQLCEGVFRAVVSGGAGEFKLAHHLLQMAKLRDNRQWIPNSSVSPAADKNQPCSALEQRNSTAMRVK